MEAKRIMVGGTRNGKKRIHSQRNTAEETQPELKLAALHLAIYICIIPLCTLLLHIMFITKCLISTH